MKPLETVGLRGSIDVAENVELVREAWSAWSRGDMARLFYFYDEAVEWDMSRSHNPDLSRVYRGHGGVRAFFRDWLETFGDYRAEAVDFLDAGDAVLVTVRQSGRGRVTGIRVTMDFWQVYRLHDARAVRVEIYTRRNEALEAVGLQE